MSWVRMTDTAAFHPIVLEVLEHPEADERSVDEVFGFMMRLASQSGAHFTDYVFAWSTAVTTAGSAARAERLLMQAQFAGYGELQVDEETGRRRFVLVADPEFIHLKTAEEDAWERQRKADNGNPGITVPVRLRDGDACRYCGNVVNWAARRGRLGGTYDHRPPGQPGSADTSVVACLSCNARRGADPVEVADERVPLMAPPIEPYYSSSTREWLIAHASILAQHGLTPPESRPDQKNLRPGYPVGGAPATSRRERHTTAAAASPQRHEAAAVRPQRRSGVATTAVPTTTAAAVRPQRQPGPAPQAGPGTTARPSTPRQAGSGRSRQVRGLQDPTSPGRDGSGRDGAGLDGASRVSPTVPLASPQPAPPDPARPRPRRRGKRGTRTRTTGGS